MFWPDWPGFIDQSQRNSLPSLNYILYKPGVTLIAVRCRTYAIVEAPAGLTMKDDPYSLHFSTTCLTLPAFYGQGLKGNGRRQRSPVKLFVANQHKLHG
jgi:hypothetical protein